MPSARRYMPLAAGSEPRIAKAKKGQFAPSLLFLGRHAFKKSSSSLCHGEKEGGGMGNMRH